MTALLSLNPGALRRRSGKRAEGPERQPSLGPGLSALPASIEISLYWKYIAPSGIVS